MIPEEEGTRRGGASHPRSPAGDVTSPRCGGRELPRTSPRSERIPLLHLGCGRAHGYPFRPGHTWNRTPGRAEAEKGGPGRDLPRRIRGAPARPGGEGAADRGDGAEPGWPVRPAAGGAAAGGGKCSDPAPQTCWRCCPRCVTAKGPTCGGASRVGGIDARSLSLSPPDRHTQVPVTFPNWNLWVR